MNKKYIKLFKNGNFTKNLIANLISALGSNIDNIAYSWLVYELTQSAFWMSLVFFASFLPLFLFEPLFGSYVDMAKKKRILLITDFLGFLITALMFLLYINSMVTITQLLVFSFLNSTLESLRRVAGVAIIPKILNQDDYAVGISFTQAISQIVSIISIALAGFIIAQYGIAAAMFIDSLTFVASFLIIATLRIKEEILTTVKISLQKIVYNLKDGFNYLVNNKTMFQFAIFALSINACFVILNYLPLYIGDYLKLGVDTYSNGQICLSLGVIVGSVTYPTLKDKLNNNKIILFSGLFACIALGILGLLSFYNTSNLISTALFILMFIIGLINGIISVMVSMSFFVYVSEEYIGRAAGCFNSLSSAVIPFTSLLLSVVTISITLDYLFMFFGLLLLVISYYFYLKGDFK